MIDKKVLNQVAQAATQLLETTGNKSELILLLADIISHCEALCVEAQFDSQLSGVWSRLANKQNRLLKRINRRVSWQRYVLKLPFLGRYLSAGLKRGKQRLTMSVTEITAEKSRQLKRERGITKRLLEIGELIHELNQRIKELAEVGSLEDEALRSLVGNWFTLYEAWYQLERPISVVNSDYLLYLYDLMAEEERLRKEGWCGLAVRVYLLNLAQKVLMVTKGDTQKLRRRVYQASRLVGSTLYQAMYEAQSEVDDASLKFKAYLVIRQLGGHIDQFGFLQLTGPYELDQELPPDSSFLEVYADTVKRAYPQGLVPSRYEGGEAEAQMIREIHQFRMYLDRQAIYYIRRQYQGTTDYDKLLAFERECIARDGQLGTLDYSSNSYFHNRTSKMQPFSGQHNDKSELLTT